MSSPSQDSGTGAVAASPRRRRPLWAWLLLALLAIAIIIAILLLAGRCGSGSETGAPPADPAAGAAGAAPPGAAPPGAAPLGAGAPGAPGAAPGGAPGTAPGAPGATDGSGGSGAPVDPAALQSRIDEIVAAEPITFRPNSPELTDSGAESLARVAEELTGAPSARATITGYSAPAGGAGTPDPQQLSDQRATAVADELAERGVARDRLQTRGASTTNPLADLASSRRAEISVS